MAPGEDSF